MRGHCDNTDVPVSSSFVPPVGYLPVMCGGQLAVTQGMTCQFTSSPLPCGAIRPTYWQRGDFFPAMAKSIALFLPF